MNNGGIYRSSSPKVLADNGNSLTEVVWFLSSLGVQLSIMTEGEYWRTLSRKATRFGKVIRADFALKNYIFSPLPGFWTYTCCTWVWWICYQGKSLEASCGPGLGGIKDLNNLLFLDPTQSFLYPFPAGNSKVYFPGCCLSRNSVLIYRIERIFWMKFQEKLG